MSAESTDDSTSTKDKPPNPGPPIKAQDKLSPSDLPNGAPNGTSTDNAPMPPPHADSLSTADHRSPNFTRGTLTATLEGKISNKLLTKADPPSGGLTPAAVLTPAATTISNPLAATAPATPAGERTRSALEPPVTKSPQPSKRAASYSHSSPQKEPTGKKKASQPSPNPNNFASNALMTQAKPASDDSAPGKVSRAPSRASSIKSEKSGDEGGKHSFRLKDLLANGPKLTRRSSQKSVGSAKSGRSDSDIDHVEKNHFPSASKSQAGESVASLSSKYGVCQKVAIGKGATSVVRLAHKWDRREEKLYAIKEFRKRRKNETEKEYVKKLTAEFCISSTLHHPNIVETVDLVQDENQKWCEVMEFCPGGDLYAAIKKGGMSPAEVECCFKQICSGVSYLHSQGVAHRDLKPENLFFDVKGHLKIGDYGASTVYRLPWESTVHMSTGLCGSEPYIAPEQFMGKPYDARLVDIWAIGIVYYCLHFQELPWRAAQQSDDMYKDYAAACQQFPLPATREQAEQAMNVQKDGREKHGSHSSAVPGCPPTINNLSPRACRPLIRHMLEPDPKKRATIEDVMEYKWYKQIPICFEQEQPGHIHANARAMANTVVKEVYEG